MTTPAQDLDRAAWLAQRRKLIGASDVAPILGVSPHRGPLAVYLQKLDLAKPDETPAMKWGLKAEALVAEAYGEESGRPVLPPAAKVILHPDIPFIGASLDRVTAGSKANPAPIEVREPRDVSGPLECKVVGIHNAAQWRQEPPLEYVVQVQFQMFVTGARWASIAAMFGWPPRPAWVDIAYNEAFVRVALPKLEEFWHHHVLREIPPPADALPATTDMIRRAWESDTGERIVLPAHAMDLVIRWEAARARRLTATKDAEAQEDQVENELRLLMKDATTGMLPDGTSLTLKTTNRVGYTVEPCSYRQLRRFIPKHLKAR